MFWSIYDIISHKIMQMECLLGTIQRQTSILQIRRPSMHKNQNLKNHRWLEEYLGMVFAVEDF